MLTINGKPVKYRGVNRLSAHPLMGRAITPEIIRQDTEMIKDANFNLIRNHIGPANPLVMDDADEFGLYVESEGPACWAEHTDDPRYAAVYQGIFAEFVERDRNHPQRRRLVDLQREQLSRADVRHDLPQSEVARSHADLQRLVRQPHARHERLSPSDHAASGSKRRKTRTKPVFFDEVLGLFHGWEDLALFEDIDPGMRDYWVTGMPEIQRAINANENQVGANQWAWVDDTFLVPGKGIGYWHRDASADPLCHADL